MPKAKLLACVEMVYAKPAGNYAQEIGGVMMTISVLCGAMGLEPDEQLMIELRRVLAKSPEHFAKRNRVKLDAGMDA